MKETARRIGFKHVIGVVVMVCFLLNNVLLSFVPIPEANKEAVYHMQGILDAAVIAIISFYYGSSAGSKTKGEALSEALKEQTK